jgi:hypothetical protein
MSAPCTICGLCRPCNDCGIDTLHIPNTDLPWANCNLQRAEWYMVADDVWRTAGGNSRRCRRDGYLCIGCLERRLGRPLRGADFPELPCNQAWLPHHSLRLRALLEERTRG